MNQSTYIVGALILGFVLYLAAKGRFTTYAGVLWGNTAAPLPSSSSSSSSGSSGSTFFGIKQSDIQTAIKLGATLA